MMSMLNHAAVEALCSATYLENYLDCMENLPDDLQRVVSQLRELDSRTNELVQDILHQKDVYVNHEDGTQKKKALIAIQRKLIKSQELGDEKLALVSCIIEHVENRTRQLEQDLENLDPGTTQPSKEPEESVSVKQVSTPVVSKTTKQAITVPSVSSVTVPVPSQPITVTPSEDKIQIETTKVKRQRRQRTAMESSAKDEEKKNEEDDKPRKKKKKRTKKDKTGDKSPMDAPIDPDEPTYCLCDQVSYGEMIGCDNDRCIIEWFHFNCVNLTHKPKGKWYCPKCRGDKPTVMRPDLIESLKREKAKGN